jgi:hypothetical protein
MIVHFHLKVSGSDLFFAPLLIIDSAPPFIISWNGHIPPAGANPPDAVECTLPIFGFFQHYLVQGLTLGAAKG